MKDLIKIWDDELIERNIGIEINYLKDYFGPKNLTELSYIDIGANVGKFYDVLSRDYSIKQVIMVEPAPQLFDYLTEKFGNPSSIYSYGREARMAVEQARKSVARDLGARPSEIFFTSGGTESSNTVLRAAVYDLGCTHIISSPIEHHATLHTVEYLKKTAGIKVSYLSILPNGHIDIENLEALFFGKLRAIFSKQSTMEHSFG